MKLFRKLLFPLSPVYYSVTWLRNKLFDAGIMTSKTYDFPIICVGNLSVGGTGKTPMVEYLIRLLKDDFSLATLSRGYKRTTQGFVLADDDATAKTIGDEPFQFYNKFKSKIRVAVDTDRQHGIAELRRLNPTPDVILLDDAYQHRKVQAGYTILLTTYANLYATDWVLPSGDLREPRLGAKRADCIVVTKCSPNISESEKHDVIKKLRPTKTQHVFFSWIAYSDEVVNASKSFELDAKTPFTLVTGIANATPLVSHLKVKHLDFEHLEFKDHHDFTEQDIKKLSNYDLLITTEKDYMRLKIYKALADKLFYLPIAIKLDRATVFNANLKQFIAPV